MADYARSLICKILSEGDLAPAKEAGIKASWFEDSEHQRAYAWMSEYFTRYGATPTPRAFKRQFPAYRLLKVLEPYEYYIDHFRDQRERSILVDGLVNADMALKRGEQGEAKAEISRALLQASTEVTSLTDEDITATMQARFDHYQTKKKNAGRLVGIRTGFPTLDMVTGGWQPQQFILLGGRAKQAKSFILMRSAVAAQDDGQKVLFMTFEMSVDEQIARHHAIISGVNAQRLIQGNMTPTDVALLKKGMRQRRNLPPFIVSADISASTTLSGLASKIDQHQPDVVFVDGVYLMENEIGAEPQSAQAFTAISRGLKRLAQRTKKPFVCSTQALESKMGKEKIVTAHSFGWTSAWSQDADLLLGIELFEDSGAANLRVIAGRNVSPRVITVLCDFKRSAFEETDPRDEDEDSEED